MKRDPESLLGAEDGPAYRRFVEWAVGDGFDMAIIKMTAPVDRKALVAWTKEQVPEAREIDLKQVGPGKSRLWELLEAARDEEHATMLILHGLEESAARQRIIAQLNVERDELVRAFAMPWVIFVHPAVYPVLVDKAPDFVDFAGLWLDEVPVEAAPPMAMPMPQTDALPERPEESAGPKDLLVEAAFAIRSSRLDHARDVLTQYDFAHADAPQDDLGRILSRCLRAFLDNQREEGLLLLREKLLPAFDQLGPWQFAVMGNVVDILRFRGEWDEALRIATDYVLPAAGRLGNEHGRALTLGRIGDNLQSRGELDEALRIRREEQIPVLEKLGDDRGLAIAAGEIAGILVRRGELKEALRIRVGEEMPVYERIGDAREYTVCMGKVADILYAMGEQDEALRIRRDVELPLFQLLGEVRARAITWMKIADILHDRDEFEEALKIYRDEVIPTFEAMGDIHARAATLGRIATLMANRGDLDEALRIHREEELPVYEHLGDAQSILRLRIQMAAILNHRGNPEDIPEIHRLLALALADARRLRLPVEIQQIEDLIKKAPPIPAP